MRNLKFRIRHEAGGHTSTVYDSKHYMLDMFGNVLEDYGDQYRPVWDVVFDANVTIQLATGIKDRNDIEIYEGDIVNLIRYKGDCSSYPSYVHEDDKPDIIKCEIRWVNCGLKACWGHNGCNQENIHSGMEIIYE